MRVKPPTTSVILPYFWNCRFDQSQIAVSGDLLHFFKGVDLVDLAPCGSQFVLAGLLDRGGVFAREFHFDPIHLNRGVLGWWFDSQDVWGACDPHLDHPALLGS